MADRAVLGTGKNQDGDITSLCNSSEAWGRRTKQEAIFDIESRTHTYYVPWQSGRTEIHIANGANGPYLRTDRDSSEQNNLRDLPNC